MSEHHIETLGCVDEDIVDEIIAAALLEALEERLHLGEVRFPQGVRIDEQIRVVLETLEHRHALEGKLDLIGIHDVKEHDIVAIMTQALALTGTQTVLEIGTGSGYQAAILSQLCAKVITMERIAELAHPAQQVLEELGVENIKFCIGDGTLGWPDQAPYDGIIVTAAAPRIPDPLYQQLKLGGRLVIPVGNEWTQRLEVVEKREPDPKIYSVCDCRFVKLIGKAGWPEET